MKKRLWIILSGSIVVLAVLIFAAAAVDGLRPRDVSRMSAGTLFQNHVCTPIPEGVYDIRASGTASLASTSILLEFRVRDESVFRQIQKNAGLTKRSADRSGGGNTLAVPANGVEKYEKVSKGNTELEVTFEPQARTCTAWHWR